MTVTSKTKNIQASELFLRIMLFVPILLNWIAFLYVGIKAQNMKFVSWGCFYLSPIICLLTARFSKATILTGVIVVFYFPIIWIVGFIHAFSAGKEIKRVLRNANHLHSEDAQNDETEKGIEKKVDSKLEERVQGKIEFKIENECKDEEKKSYKKDYNNEFLKEYIKDNSVAEKKEYKNSEEPVKTVIEDYYEEGQSGFLADIYEKMKSDSHSRVDDIEFIKNEESDNQQGK